LASARRRRHAWLLVIALLVAVTAVTHVWWLRALGRLLVDAETPRKVQLIVVPAGDWTGGRILKASELLRQGYAPRALVSSPTHHYGVPEADLAIQFAEKHGYSRSLFDALPITGNSTGEEAREVMAEVRRRGVTRLLIVTSDFHTRRARRIYEGIGSGIEIYVTAAPHARFHTDSWWQDRESRKVWLLEFVKLVTGAVGI
jgi:uncharacterized SAM-binding protein YcdF (DUF218 family)